MNFAKRLINMIKNIYVNTICQPLNNDVEKWEFEVTSAVPEGCSLFGVLFNMEMIPLLPRHNSKVI